MIEQKDAVTGGDSIVQAVSTLAALQSVRMRLEKLGCANAVAYIGQLMERESQVLRESRKSFSLQLTDRPH